ncbi:uncharacterized protein LOC129591488 isoform X2 [Paramacrobiotus metropolitanus]|uniref:uncharacterized protein LOC129591488 isoform X2 n=1 Tax=Paramacrobiotus metropolitanus TaxID=2943436 RepID=UPI002445EA4F|nr:uncharacterized protein LOC129591488 isoform X2 [Paramacrobiotus metropolitanus]
MALRGDHIDYGWADSDGRPRVLPLPPPPFHTLPVELVARVFSYLDIFEVLKCSTVCKRWKAINQAPRVHDAIIIDLLKWDKYGCNCTGGYPEPEYKKQALIKTKPLMQRFITRFTRQLLIRWPLDTSPPSADFAICTEYHSEYPVSEDEFYSGHDKSVAHSIQKVMSILEVIHGGSDGRALELKNLKLVVQHLNLYTNTLWDVIPQFLHAVTFDNVNLHCHFHPTGNARPNPIILRTIVAKETITRDEMWLFGLACGSRWEIPLKRGISYPQDQMRYNHPMRNVELFGRLIVLPLSEDDEIIMQCVLRSSSKIGHLADYWITYFGLQGSAGAWAEKTLAETELTLDKIRRFPRWLQYLARDLLQYYPHEREKDRELTYDPCGASVQRMLGPFIHKHMALQLMSHDGIYQDCGYTKPINVPPPLW